MSSPGPPASSARRGSALGVPHAPVPAAAGHGVTIRAREESAPGPFWRSWWEELGPAYLAWYLKDGDAARPHLNTCRRMLATHMPELVPVHERLVELAGGGDLEARLLSLYSPPPFITGCSQAAWPGDKFALIRNYDYPEALLEGLLLSSAWRGRRVIGMSDCLWGLLDGMNDAGLAASLTFGGRRAKGDGFAIPLVLRYVLEVCADVEEACAVLGRVPVHTAQNVTLLDRSGAYVTAHLGPDIAPEFRRTRVTTNHQGRVEWPEYERAVRSLEREQRLEQLVQEPGMSAQRLLDAFLQPPLHSGAHATGSGTLYTAAYFVADGRMELRWPGARLAQSFADFRETDRPVSFRRTLLAA